MMKYKILFFGGVVLGEFFAIVVFLWCGIIEANLRVFNQFNQKTIFAK